MVSYIRFFAFLAVNAVLAVASGQAHQNSAHNQPSGGHQVYLRQRRQAIEEDVAPDYIQPYGAGADNSPIEVKKIAEESADKNIEITDNFVEITFEDWQNNPKHIEEEADTIDDAAQIAIVAFYQEAHNHNENISENPTSVADENQSEKNLIEQSEEPTPENNKIDNVTVVDHNNGKNGTENEGEVTEELNSITSAAPVPVISWTTCDIQIVPRKRCYDCNSLLICKSIGGLIKRCNNPFRPYCAHGTCSPIPSAECTAEGNQGSEIEETPIELPAKSALEEEQIDVIVAAENAGEVDTENERKETDEVATTTTKTPMPVISWTTCDIQIVPRKRCYDCNSLFICKPIGGLIKRCNNPFRPYCNNGNCSPIPSAECLV